MSRAHLDADDAASLRRELAWLRKRGGFTAARLGHAPIVDEGSSLLMWCRGLRGVWSLAGERGGVG